jgi:asparagine synthase (glutamine-hydrolysing)
VWRVEGPTCKTSNAAYMQLYKMAKPSSTVILTGEGADEALGGYPNIRMMKVLDFCARHPNLRGADRLMNRLLPPGSIGRVMYHEPQPLAADEEARVRQLFGCIPADLERFRSQQAMKATLFSDDVLAEIDGYSAEVEFAETLVNRDLIRDRHFVQQAQYFEYLLKLPNYLLTNPGDRAAMTHSVENRCPYLDHEFIELCMGLPLHLRVRGLTEKYALRKAFAAELPPEILRRSKRPFTTFYISSIYRDKAPEFLHEVLSERAIRSAGLFRWAGVEELKRRLQDPALTKEEQVQLETPFALIVTTQLWHQQYIESFRADTPSMACQAAD